MLVGANDLGQKFMKEVVDDVYELLCFLQDLNSGAAVYCCEVTNFSEVLVQN